MSARAGYEMSMRFPVEEEPVSPNRQDPNISVHIRVYWPCTATDEEIMGSMLVAFSNATEAMRGKLEAWRS